MQRYVACGMVALLYLAVQPATAADQESRGGEASGESSSATTQAPAFTRLRILKPYVAQLLNDGQQKSPTFRGLIRAVEDSDLLVYVIQWNKLATFVQRGGVTVGGNVTVGEAANGRRIVFIVINPVLPPDHATAMIAHELQHAIEIANAPQVVDHTSLIHYYQRIGIQTSAQSYDTAAARAIQNRVLAELNGDEGAWDALPRRTGDASLRPSRRAGRPPGLGGLGRPVSGRGLPRRCQGIR